MELKTCRCYGETGFCPNCWDEQEEKEVFEEKILTEEDEKLMDELIRPTKI